MAKFILKYCFDDWKLYQKKIINDTGICVESCENNTQYQYEFNGKCYQKCLDGYFFDDNNKRCKCELEKCFFCTQESFSQNLCTQCNIDYYPKENYSSIVGEFFDCYKDPEGYYLDKFNNIYKKCYYTCETCELAGDEINHNCIKCNSNFSIEINLTNYTNCYNNETYPKSLITERIDYSYIYNTSIILQFSNPHFQMKLSVYILDYLYYHYYKFVVI